MPSVIWCLVHVGFMKKYGILEEGSVLVECGKRDGNQMGRGNACLWLMTALSAAGVHKDPAFQLNYALGEHPFPETGHNGPCCPAGWNQCLDFWLKDSLHKQRQLLEIFCHNGG